MDGIKLSTRPRTTRMSRPIRIGRTGPGAGAARSMPPTRTRRFFRRFKALARSERLRSSSRGGSGLHFLIVGGARTMPSDAYMELQDPTVWGETFDEQFGMGSKGRQLGAFEIANFSFDVSNAQDDDSDSSDNQRPGNQRPGLQTVGKRAAI